MIGETLWKCPTCGAEGLIATVDLPHVICVGCEDKKPPEVQRQSNVPESCEHRSKVALRREWCSPCQGYLKVFACSIHGECMIGKANNGVRSCKGCRDKT